MASIGVCDHWLASLSALGLVCTGAWFGLHESLDKVLSDCSIFVLGSICLGDWLEFMLGCSDSVHLLRPFRTLSVLRLAQYLSR